jgi:hypothetical protein
MFDGFFQQEMTGVMGPGAEAGTTAQGVALNPSKNPVKSSVT